MDDVEEVFSGKFKEQRGGDSSWTAAPEDAVPRPRWVRVPTLTRTLTRKWETATAEFLADVTYDLVPPRGLSHWQPAGDLIPRQLPARLRNSCRDARKWRSIRNLLETFSKSPVGLRGLAGTRCVRRQGGRL